jgi:hypothetical protein
MMFVSPLAVMVLLLLLLPGETYGNECTNEEAKNELESILKADILFVKQQTGGGGGGGCLVQFRHMPR